VCENSVKSRGQNESGCQTIGAFFCELRGFPDASLQLHCAHTDYLGATIANFSLKETGFRVLDQGRIHVSAQRDGIPLHSSIVEWHHRLARRGHHQYPNKHRPVLLQGVGRADRAKGDFYWGDELAYEPVTPDRNVEEGDKLELGGVTLMAHLTPGHTKGCTSWSMQVNENGKEYNVLFLCGLTVSPYKLTNNERYPNIVSDVRDTFARLKGVHVDVMLASHAFYFDLESKVARQKQGSANPFVAPDELGHHLEEIEQDFEQALQAQERQR
jgi:hypothetical protein